MSCSTRLWHLAHRLPESKGVSCCPRCSCTNSIQIQEKHSQAVERNARTSTQSISPCPSSRPSARELTSRRATSSTQTKRLPNRSSPPT